MWDVKICGADVLDGAGSEILRVDIAVKDGRIAGMGESAAGRASVEIDGNGRVACPGFIDLHTHAYRKEFIPPGEEKYARSEVNLAFLRQGVTFLVGGNCGFSPADIGKFAGKYKDSPGGANISMLIGHNTARRAVLGNEDRHPEKSELEAMKRIIAKGMEEGAAGFSTGLAYVPGSFADTDEVVELAREAARYGGYYATHIRNESRGVIAAVEEALSIGRTSGLPVHISHHKLTGEFNSGRSVETLGILDRARKEKMDVTHDVYPYTAGCGSIRLLFPSWAISGDVGEIRNRMDNPEKKQKIVGAVAEQINEVFAGDLSRIVISECGKDPSVEGKSLEVITRERKNSLDAGSVAETVMELLKLDPSHGGVMHLRFACDESDVQRIMKNPFTSIASDACEVEFGRGHPHPRHYGTFPRVLGRYCREKKLFPLSEAVRKMTSLPASRLGLTDRGVLKVGAWADVVVFDSGRITDMATYREPHRYPEGVDYVLVNGKIVIDRGRHTGELPGVFVGRPAQCSRGGSRV